MSVCVSLLATWFVLEVRHRTCRRLSTPENGRRRRRRRRRTRRSKARRRENEVMSERVPPRGATVAAGAERSRPRRLKTQKGAAPRAAATRVAEDTVSGPRGKLRGTSGRYKPPPGGQPSAAFAFAAARPRPAAASAAPPPPPDGGGMPRGRARRRGRPRARATW